jgi:hypothetical protein
LKTYGTLANPVPELPPAATFDSVRWRGGDTVKWPSEPFSYLHAAATDELDDGFRGTLSFWARANGVLPGTEGFPGALTHYGFTGVVFRIVVVPGPHAYDYYSYVSNDVTHIENVPDDGFQIYFARWNGGNAGLEVQVYSSRSDGTSQTVEWLSNKSASDAGQVAADVIDDKWAHFLVTWDFEASCTIVVNKATKPVYEIFKYTEELPLHNRIAYNPQPVPWTQRSLWFGGALRYEGEPVAVAQIGPGDPVTPQHIISYAHVWCSTTEVITDVAKFVDADGKPAKFGAEHEVIFKAKTIKPDYYFAGGPEAFVKNKAGGGEMILAGKPPIAQSAPVKIGE